MSKTNDTVRELRDDELENVSGGCCNGEHINEVTLGIVVTKHTDVPSSSYTFGSSQAGG